MKPNRVKWILRYGVMLCFRIWFQTDLNSSSMQISLTFDCVTQASYLAASLTHLLLSIFPLPYWLYWAYAPSRAYWGGPQPRALTSTHQRLLMEDVNICSGASHGSPSLCRDCSEHINISEAKGTSGHAVPPSVRTGKHDGGWDRVLPSIACVWTPSSHSFLSSWWPSDPVLPLGQDSWWQQQPIPNEASLVSSIPWPWNCLWTSTKASCDTSCLPNSVTNKNTVAR